MREKYILFQEIIEIEDRHGVKIVVHKTIDLKEYAKSKVDSVMGECEMEHKNVFYKSQLYKLKAN